MTDHDNLEVTEAKERAATALAAATARLQEAGANEAGGDLLLTWLALRRASQTLRRHLVATGGLINLSPGVK